MGFLRWGGKRAGAGRKPRGARAGSPHSRRERLSGREPVLVTMKVRPEIRSLRTRRAFQRALESFAGSASRGRIRIVHFSVQRDHLHLIVEAADTVSLSRGVQGLAVRIARKLNKLLGRRGKVFAHRYHSRALRTPREVRNVLRYVLLNARKHGVAARLYGWLDPFSSATAFVGWGLEPVVPLPIERPRTWLLTVGWHRAGPVFAPDEQPGSVAA